MDIDIEAKNRLIRRLEKARAAALKYLTGYDPRDLMSIMDAIDEDLECLDCWDDENNCPEFGYSHVDLLQQLDYKAGVFMFEDKKLYEIDVMDIFATFAFVKAIEGIAILKKSSEIVRYSLAAESCIDAFDALHYGKHAQKRAEVASIRVLEAEKLSDWSVMATAKRNKKRYEEEGKYIVSVFEEVCKNPEDILILEWPKRDNPEQKKLKKYRIRSNGQMDLDTCARYIFHHEHEIPAILGKATSFDRKLRYVKRMIKNHVLGEHVDTNDHDQSLDVQAETLDELIERRVFPKRMT